MVKVAKQKGIALLAMVIILLGIMGLLALMMMKSTTNEQRITGNDLRSRQALDAADAGLAYGIADAIADSITTETDVSGADITTLNGQLNPGGDSYTAGSVVSIKICAANNNRTRVIAVGQSNDGDASRTVDQWFYNGGSSATSGVIAGTWRDYDVSTTC